MGQKPSAKKKGIVIVILLLLIIIIGLCIYIFLSGNKGEGTSEAAAQTESAEAESAKVIAVNQGDYVEPEQPVDRSKNVTLPGWGGFTIPANEKEITKGFEFYNPAENFWYEDQISIDGNVLENLVVDSGNKVELDHYLGIAGIDESVSEVTDYGEDCFKIEKSDDGIYTVEAISNFEGTKTIGVKTDEGSEVSLDIACTEDCYYMAFGLYLTEGDELLYQSDLVSPGKYIQQMEMTRELEAGTYEAYVVCQPYRSDMTTKTNQGVVNITLTAQ